MRGLNHKEADAIDAVYFRNLRHREASEEVGISVGYLSHVLDSAISKMAEYCIPVYPLVCRFRESIEQKRSEAVKAELETQKKRAELALFFYVLFRCLIIINPQRFNCICRY